MLSHILRGLAVSRSRGLAVSRSRGLAVSPSRVPAGERGIAGIQTGLLLLGPVVAAAALGGAIISAGTFGTEAFDLAAFSAVRRSTSGVELRGPIHLRTDGERPTHILLDVGTTAGESPVPLSRARGSAPTVVRYIDAANIANDLPYDVDWIRGDGDALLETGELAQVVVDITGIQPAGTHFTIEVLPAFGLAISAERTLPSGRQLDRVLRLY